MKTLSINIGEKTYSSPSTALKKFTAIKNLKFKVAKDQFCCLIGPSGCGKTTLLNIISGLDCSAKGYIKYDNNSSIKDLRISYMFQTPRLLPWLNVLENVEIVLDKQQKEKGRAIEILSIMGLKDFLDFYPNKLSGGMQRRVALARSFSIKPDLFILDEPFVSLDEPAAKLLRKMLLNLWSKEPTTVIFVTHNLTEAFELGDKIVFLSKSPAKVIKEIDIKIKRPRGINNPEVDDLRKKFLSENQLLLEGKIK